MAEYEDHGRILNQKYHSRSEHKRPSMSCQGVFIYFTDTLEAMKNFGSGHKNH